MSQRKKTYPCIKCDEHVGKNDKAVQCTFCELWIHHACSGMSNELYKEICAQAEYSGHFWVCKSCKSSSFLFKQQLINLDKRVGVLENKDKEHQENIAKAQGGIEEVKRDVDNLKLSQGKSSDEATDTVFSEIRERENRKNNIVHLQLGRAW